MWFNEGTDTAVFCAMDFMYLILFPSALFQSEQSLTHYTHTHTKLVSFN